MAKLMIISALLAFGAAPALAQQATPALQALDDALPGTLINDPTRIDWAGYGEGLSQRIVQSADIPGGGAAIRVSVASAGQTHYAAGLNVPLTGAIASGDNVVVAFYARTISASTDDGLARVGVRFQANAAPYPGFGDRILTIGREWQLYQVTARADRAIGRSVAVVGLQLSAARQELEIGQLMVASGTTTLTPPAVAAAALPEPEMPPSIATRGRLLNEPRDRRWTLFGAQTNRATETNVYLRTATEFTIAAAGANPFDAGASIPVPQAIAEGDMLTIAFLARTISASTADGQGVIGVRMQRNVAPFEGFGDRSTAIGPNWRLYQMRTRAPFALPAGSGQVALHLAGAAQVVEVGPVYIIRDTPAAATTTP